MMLLDGYHNKKRYGSIKQTEERTKSNNNNITNISNNVIAELRATIKQDVKTCLTRVVTGIKQTRESGGSNLWLSGENRDINGGADAHKSTLDKFLGDQFFKSCSSQLGLHQTRSFKQHHQQQQRLPPTSRTNLSRSFSVQQRKSDTNNLRLRYQLSTETLHRADKSRNCSKSTNKINGTSWSFGVNKFSIASVLPILACLLLIVLPISIENASLVPQQRSSLNPIWLTEGLINLDDEAPPFLHQIEQDNSPLGQDLIDILANKQQLSKDEQLQTSWTPFGQEIVTDDGSSDLQEPDKEQLWVQRRRLDRIRASEPPPWMREQPMRRGYNPGFLAKDENLGSTTGDPGNVNLVADSSQISNAKKLIPNRKLRQSSDEVYDEVLRYLIEEAFQGRDFLNDIYDELDRRTKPNSNSQFGLKFSSDGSPQKQQQLQTFEQKVANQQSANSNSVLDADDLRNSDSDPNPALIVVGDEVSTGDGSASAVEPSIHETHANIKAVHAEGQPGYEQQPTDLIREGEVIMMKQQQNPTVNSQYNGIPVRFEKSPYTFDTPVANVEQNLQQSRFSSISSQEPFHVLEEIDQIDDSQAVPHVTLSDGGDNTASQSSQFNELLSTNDGILEDETSQFPAAKRDTRPSSELSIPTTSGDYYTTASNPSPKWLAQPRTIASTSNIPLLRKSSKVGIAFRMIESGYLNREQLVQVATKLKSYLEDMIGLRRGSVLDLYPINPQQLLVKLDTTKLSALQIMDMIQKYDFARGFIVLSWPQGSQSNPMPILVAVLNELARNNPNVRVATLVPAATTSEDDSVDTTADSRGSVSAERLVDDLNEDDEQLLAPDGEADIMAEEQAAAFMNRPRIPLAAITALLGAIYANQDRLRDEQLPSLVAMPDSQALLAAKGQQHQPLINNPHLIQLSAILLAVVGAFVAVKLVMRGQDNRMLLRRNLSRSSRSLRSYWSFGNGSQEDDADQGGNIVSSDGKVVGGDSAEHKCRAGNLATNRHLAAETDSIVTEGDEHQKRNLEQLSRRLVSILSGFSHHRHSDGLDTKKSDLEGGISSSSSKSDSGLSEDDQQQQQTPYRSSRSYIKALIDVLSKARPFSSNAACEQDDPESRLALFEPDVGQNNGLGESSDESQIDQEVLLSQMDITAAHLILSYMESHLEDKERLRREWLQLSGGSGNLNLTKAKVGAKMSEPVLQRLAKVALNEENRDKNRDPSMVAFDGNRVKLNAGQHLQQQQQQRTAQLAGKLRQRTSSSSSSTSDYINASFVYDDDPSRPTHIIAQGPLEQTVGQFWQMIWEQGISVIVMLTRLNENSSRQCHCYWPTGTTASATGTATANSPRTSIGGGGGQLQPSGNVSPSQSLDDDAAAPAAPATTAAAPPANGNAKHSNETTTTSARRGSVTSVFSMTAASRSSGQSVGGIGGAQKGQPIIGNKDLLSNVISFDVCSVVPSGAIAVTADEPLSSTSELEPDDKKADSFEQQDLPTTTTTTNNNNKSSSKSKRRQQEVANRHKSQQQQQQQPLATATATTKVIRFEVHLVSEHVSSNDYLVRNMCLVNRSTGETRTITQFHYLSWPDGGVPDNVKNLLQFRRKVHKSYRSLKSPILVHCSDGAGRSGTYTLIDIILERIRNGAKEIDPMATLVHLREQRVGLCANLSQFEFVLMALAEEIQIILDALPQ